MSDLRTDRNARPVPSETEQAPGNPKKMITAAIALGAVAAFGIGIWFAYDQGVKRGASGAPPLIRADQGPTKVAPENPGGMQVPNQDKQIYERITGNTNQQGPQTERLLPPPERPIAPPAPTAAPSAPQPNVAVAPTGNGAANGGVTIPMRPTNGVPNQTTAPSPVPSPSVVGSTETKSADQSVETAAEKTAEKGTEKPASTQTAAAPKPAARVASPGGTAKVQLASLKDQAAAQSTWSQLQKKYPDILGDLSPSYERVEIPNKGTFIRLQAGPLKDRAAAQAVCQQLAAKNQGCIVVGR